MNLIIQKTSTIVGENASKCHDYRHSYVLSHVNEISNNFAQKL